MFYSKRDFSRHPTGDAGHRSSTISDVRPRTHVPNLHIIMRRILLGQMMAVMLRQLSASASSILIWGSVWGFPSMIEISVRKLKIRLIVLAHTMIQIKKFIVFKY
jgi:hypothetical protein